MTRKRALWIVLAGVALLAGILTARRMGEEYSAIPPQGGRSFKLPPLAGPHYRQNDPLWAGETIGGLGESMARAGCAVCGLAMALDIYGARMNPKELNDALKACDGYNPRGWLRWNAVEKVSGGKAVIDSLARPDYALIDRAVDNRQAVLAKVYINGLIPHWVLIAGKDGQEYLIRDPLGEDKAIGRLSDYQSKIYSIRTLKSGPAGR